MTDVFKQFQFLTDAQLQAEFSRCLYCEDKPCRNACPANCSPADFIMAARKMTDADFRRAAAHILTLNPLGGVCGVVCPDKHCMKACTRGKLDMPVNIPAVQAAIVNIAFEKCGTIPMEKAQETLSGKRVAVVGSGPAGLACAAYLARKGCSVEIFEKESLAGGSLNLIPDFRLPRIVINKDIEFILSLGKIRMSLNNIVNEPAELLKKGFDAVVVAAGRQKPIKAGIENEDMAIEWNEYLWEPARYAEMLGSKVAVIGGGATAVDCATQARRYGAKEVVIFYRRSMAEMPLTDAERHELFKYGIDVVPRAIPVKIKAKDGKVAGITVKRVSMPERTTSRADSVDVPDSVQEWNDVTGVISATGGRQSLGVADSQNNTQNNTNNSKGLKIFYAGDIINGATTVVEAVASGKNIALRVEKALTGAEESPTSKSDTKSVVVIPGYNFRPVSLEADFFGRKIETPFLLSASPLTDGYEQMKKAYEVGWAGGVMKTAFDNVPIHIPDGYMGLYDESTYANCDNVSGHPLDRVCEEVKRLVREYPHKLTLASTGGPVTGNDEHDRRGWQSNTLKLEKAGAMGIEYSLSCPQGGDGTEGAIVSQNAALSAKIIDWVLEVSNPDIPKLFKLTGAVTSIAKIVQAVKEVFNRYPNKKAGITLANSFPSMDFKPLGKKTWENGRVMGAHGQGVLHISYLTLASVSHLGVIISGNGGPMDYKAAADFLALGCRTVQFCTMPTKYGLGIYNELCEGVSHLMLQRGIKSVYELIGRALPDPITDFMHLSAEKKISQVIKEKCISCGNCTRCPYLAITMGSDGIPNPTDASKCIGCSICALKCPALAIVMRERSPEEKKALVH